MQREISYTCREGPPLHRQGSASHPHTTPNSPPPTPASHSMPPSPSRIPYGGARPLSGQGNAAIPKERLVNMPASRSISPSPSAILERRDVKPDEDLSNKNVQLLRNEGMYADPYMYHEGRMSVASSHTGHPLEIPDHIFAYHRGALRSSSTYSNSSVQSEMMEQSIYRQKSRKYTDSHLPGLGFVEDLKSDSTSVNKGVTLKDVEDEAFSLRQIGEAVANLKGAFPPLQNKMRAVLRVEVEAVRFLKEEPHKLDSLLKRIRNMTDILTALRRHVTEGAYKGTESTHKVQYIVKEKTLEPEPLRSHDELTRVQTFTLQTASGIAQESKASSGKSEPFSTMTVHHVQSSPVLMHHSQQSTALVNHSLNSPAATCNTANLQTAGDQAPSTPVTTQESVVVIQHAQTPQSPPVSINGSSTQGFFINEIHHASFRNRAVSIEEAEKKWEEKRQNLDHYNGKEFEKLLEEAQANIMKSIPNLEMPPQSPRVDSVEKLEVFEETADTEEENDKATRSPPPPPPRRIYPPGSGLAPTRTVEVIHAIKKGSTKEFIEDVSPTSQPKMTRSQTEDHSSCPTPPLVADSVTKDDDEQEGERIMAELQAFQKCSFMEVNSKNHVEQSRTESQAKDTRPLGLMYPKEKKASSGSSQTSRMPIPMASKSRQQGSMDKTAKQPKLQEPQRQYRQANGGTKKAGGDVKATSPTLTSSRIPAFSPTSGKSSSLPAYCGESPNPLSPSTKSPVSPSNPLSPQTGRTINSAPLIPSIPNGSSKNQSPTYTGKGHHLSFSPQTSNGRPSLSSSSSSPTTPTSPPSLGQGAKNIRTIHTPNFTSYKSQNGNARKPTTSTTKETP